MKSKIINLLDSFGLQISRTPGRISRQIDFHKTSRPFFIDFMGPSGVGKTTLFNEVYKQRSKNLDWITPEEFVHNKKFTFSDIVSSFHQDILEFKINEILRQKTFRTSDKLGLLDFINKIIRKEVIINHYNQNQKIVFEDGFFHVFGFEIKELVEKDFKTYQGFIQNRALVFCYTEPENLVENILKRSKTDWVRTQHKNLSKEELLIQEEKTLEQRRELAYFFRDQNLPFLEIHTFENLKENAKKVNDFIEKLK